MHHSTHKIIKAISKKVLFTLFNNIGHYPDCNNKHLKSNIWGNIRTTFYCRKNLNQRRIRWGDGQWYRRMARTFTGRSRSRSFGTNTTITVTQTVDSTGCCIDADWLPRCVQMGRIWCAHTSQGTGEDDNFGLWD